MIVDLLPTDDQRMIEDGIAAFLADRLPVSRLREAAARHGAPERAIWQELTMLGLFGLGVSEDLGGLGLGLPEEVLAARALGRQLVSPALLAQIVAPHLVPDDAALRTALIAGEARAALASEAHLLDGDGADVVVVMTGDGAALLPCAALGDQEDVAGIDETVKMARIVMPGDGRQSDGARASLLVAAYLTGIAQSALAMAIEHAKTREQFGQPIGAFQAIKHQCADMATHAAAAEAQVFHTAVTLGRGLDDACEVAAARVLARDAAIGNARQSIQIHGGMGFTAECDAHLYLKRAHLLSAIGSSKAAERAALLGDAA